MENTLREILRVLEPLPEHREARWQFLRELQGAVESVETLRGATVEPFGSFVSELFTRWGDLDVSIEFSKGAYISSYGKKHSLDVLKDVKKALKGRVGWCQFIRHARVPILLVQSYRGNISCDRNISCDISVNNLKGQMKSKLLLWISDIDPRFRDMILLVKEWAKAHNINNSKSGTFNSYSLSLLVVFHFQTCVPAILPPLQDIYLETLTDDLQGLRDDAERRIENSCVENIRRFKLNKSRAQNKSSLSELFISFLGKFSDLSSKAVELGICTYSGKWEVIESNMGWLPKTYCILVEDPFDRPENTARGVSERSLNRISQVFEMSRSTLIAARYSSSLAIESSLLPSLVRPETLHLIIGNRGYNIEHNQTALPHNFMAESSHSRTPRHYNGLWKLNDPYAREKVSPRDCNYPPKPYDPYAQDLVPPENHRGPRKPTGSYPPKPYDPYAQDLVPPENHRGPRKVTVSYPPKPYDPYAQDLVPQKNYSGPRKPTGPYVREFVDSSPRVHQVRNPVHSSSQAQPQMQKPMHSSSLVRSQIQKQVRTQPQVQLQVLKTERPTSQVESPLQKKKGEKAQQLLLQKQKAPMLQACQEWRPKKPGMQL